MNNLTRPTGAWLLAAALYLSSSFLFNVTAHTATRSGITQNARDNVAYQRGYPNGYGDGFAAGRSDYLKRLDRDYRTPAVYQRAERSYRLSDGNREDYLAGYRLGYDLGYLDGYYGRPYSGRLPSNALAFYRLTEAVRDNWGTPTSSDYILPGTKLTLRLDITINTQTIRVGDRFYATVVNQRQYERALVEGHITKLNRSGRVASKTELALAFDTITLHNGRSGPLRGEVKALLASRSVKTVEEKGNIEIINQSHDTALRTGASTVYDAIIGAISGGGKGTAIGTLSDAGVDAGLIYVQGKQDLILEPGTELIMEVAALLNNSARR